MVLTLLLIVTFNTCSYYVLFFTYSYGVCVGGLTSPATVNELMVDALFYLLKFLTCYTSISCTTRRVAVYLETHYNIVSKRAFPIGVLDR